MDVFWEKEKAREGNYLKEERVEISKIRQKRKAYEIAMKMLMLVSTLLTGLLVIFLLSYVLIKGIPNISIEFLTTKPSYITEKIGILPDILNTVYIVIATLFVVLPLGV